MTVRTFRHALATLAGLAAMAAAPAARGALLVTEFMPDPTGTDKDREWFEIYNSGPDLIDLAGYAAGDGTDPAGTSAGEGMGVFPAGAKINAGQTLVIAANANGFFGLYGKLPDYEFFNGSNNAANTNASTLGNNADVPDLTQKSGWGAAGSTLAIANGGDDIGILTPDSTAAAYTFVDGANHGSVHTFFDGAPLLGGNQSLERVPAGNDTNAAADFVVRTTGTATPGSVTVPEPATLAAGLAAAGLLATRRRGRRD